MKPWTKTDLTSLRRLKRQGKKFQEIAVILDRTTVSVKSKCVFLGLCTRRPWSIEEALFVKRNYATMNAQEIAEQLGRCTSSVYQTASKLGLPRKAAPLLPANTRERIRKLHARKMTDQEIANKLKIDRRYVSELRSGMGLKVHGDRLLEIRRAAVKTQWKRLGIKNRAGLRWLKYRKYAREHGLPEHIRFRAVQVAYAFARHGPMTRRQLCSVLGWKWQSVRKCGLNANDKEGTGKSTYLAELMNEAIVVCMKRALQTGRRGGNLNVYDLTPAWRERITAHVEQKQLAAGAPGLPA